MKDNIVLISRAGYELITENENLIETLQSYNLFAVYSIRTHELPPRSCIKELHLVELRESEQYLPALVSTIDQRNSIKHVVSISEQDLIPAAHARKALNLPGLTIEQAENYRDKALMKSKLQKSGIHCADYAIVHNFKEAETFLLKHGKIILKPRDGYGSQECQIVDGRSSLMDAWKLIEDHPSRYILEQFISLPVYHFDALVRDGELIFASLGSYERPPLNFAASEWRSTRLSNESTPLYQQGTAMLLKVLQAFDTADGVFHLEFFANEDETFFNEIAIRPGGGGITEAIYHAWGVHLNEEHVRIQLELPSKISDKTTFPVRFAASQLYISLNSGKLRNVNIPGLLANESVKSAKVHYKIGEHVDKARYSSDSVLAAALVSDSREALETGISFVKEHSKITIE